MRGSLGSARSVLRRAEARLAELRDRLLKSSRVDLREPVFVWGAPRSGTHLLYDILSLHPALTCPKTDHRLKKGLWGDMHWGPGTPERLRDRRIPYEGLERCWLGAGLEFDSVGLFGRERLSGAVVASVRTRYADLQRDWPWRGGSEFRVLDKCPTYILMLDAIDAVFPDSRHVFCVRDPRAVLNSLLRVHRFPEAGTGDASVQTLGFAAGVPPGHEEHRHEPLVRRLAWQVRALHELGLDHARRLGERVVELRYERLVGAAHEAAASLFERLRLAAWPELRELIPDRFPDYSPPWPRPGEPVGEPYGKKRCWTDEEQAELDEIERFAVAIGYEPHRPGKLVEEPAPALAATR